MNTSSEHNKPEQQPSHNPEVIQVDRREAARMLNSPATFDRVVKRGLIRSNRATGRPKFSIAELQRFVDECST